jgi:hypothetical protein
MKEIATFLDKRQKGLAFKANWYLTNYQKWSIWKKIMPIIIKIRF